MTKKTCLFEKHVAYGGKMVDFAGFDMPIQYEGILAEHQAVRNSVGIFDVSHMGKFTINGSGAANLINQLITNDISVMTDEQAMYSPMCYENGGTVDDILVYRYSLDSYLLVVNAANKIKDYQWIEAHMIEEVAIKDITDDLCQIAVQGPKALALVQSLTDTNVTEIPYYHFKDQVVVGDVPMLVSRTGYTGEDGFELYFSSNYAHKIWDLLVASGKEMGIKPCGLGARDTLRFEAGMPLYGNELSEEINPVEAGLNYFIKFNKDSFIGKDALAAYKENRKRKMVGFELLDKGLPRHGAEVIDSEGNVIGSVTTGYKSPSFIATIGIALVPWTFNEETLKIKVRNKILEAKIINKRFFKVYGKA